MEKRTAVTRPQIAGYETVMEGADMQVLMMTLAAGESVPWHYHSEIANHFFCLDGLMVVETRAPSAVTVLKAGESCFVPPKVAHYVHGKDDGPCRFLNLQGVGVYDKLPVGAP